MLLISLALLCNLTFAYNEIPSMRHRPSIGDFLQAEGKDFKVGAEIGVQAGLYTQALLRRWSNCKTMYLIDIWERQENYHDGANVDNAQQDKLMRSTVQRLSSFKEKLKLMRMYSSQAAEILRNENTDPSTGILSPPLDFAYIDARHDYCGATEDIQSYWPLIKSGGLLTGHDYLTDYQKGWDYCADGSYHPGSVYRAVNEFVEKNGLKLVTTYGDKYESWLVRKP